MGRFNNLSIVMMICVVLGFGTSSVHSFSLTMMAKRGRGNLKKTLSDKSISKKKAGGVPNEGKGQEITGVTLPATGKIKGWEFGDKVRMACANVDDEFFAVQGECPRCGFDLWRGDIIGYDDDAFDDLPRIACPTCSTTYSLISGKMGPPLKRTGLAGFVNNLATSATAGDRPKDAQAFKITIDDEGRVYCLQKPMR